MLYGRYSTRYMLHSRSFRLSPNSLKSYQVATAPTSSASKQQRSWQRIASPSEDFGDEGLHYASQECSTQRHSPGDTRTAIIRSDSDSTFGVTRLDFEAYVEPLRQQSPMFADPFALVRMKCLAWSLKAKGRFPGPFSAKRAYPMLMVGNLADPVTPIRK